MWWCLGGRSGWSYCVCTWSFLETAKSQATWALHLKPHPQSYCVLDSISLHMHLWHRYFWELCQLRHLHLSLSPPVRLRTARCGSNGFLFFVAVVLILHQFSPLNKNHFSPPGELSHKIEKGLRAVQVHPWVKFARFSRFKSSVCCLFWLLLQSGWKLVRFVFHSPDWKFHFVGTWTWALVSVSLLFWTSEDCYCGIGGLACILLNHHISVPLYPGKLQLDFWSTLTENISLITEREPLQRRSLTVARLGSNIHRIHSGSAGAQVANS